MTPLMGADGEVYAIAQGNMVVGGLGVQGGDGSSVVVNVPTVGRVPRGATVERMVETSFLETEYFVLNLNRPDFSTASNVADAINAQFGAGVAVAFDGSSVRVRAPADPAARVPFMGLLQDIEVDPAAPPAQVNGQDGGVVVPGNAVVTPDTQIDVEQENNPAFVFDPGVSLASLVDAINAVGASAADLVAILEALHRAGALRAELIVI